MAAGRRAFLRTGAAAAAAAALGPAPLSAQGKGPIRLAYLQLGWAATEIIHKEDLLGKRGWQAEYSIVPGAPGPLLNQLASKNVDAIRSEEHTSELQSRSDLVCRLLLEKKKNTNYTRTVYT